MWRGDRPVVGSSPGRRRFGTTVEPGGFSCNAIDRPVDADHLAT
jgi:hypothetical protein